MLILGRREGQSIQIHIDGMETIRIELNRVTGWNQARIGIDAPRHVQIVREELLYEPRVSEPVHAHRATK